MQVLGAVELALDLVDHEVDRAYMSLPSRGPGASAVRGQVNVDAVQMAFERKVTCASSGMRRYFCSLPSLSTA